MFTPRLILSLFASAMVLLGPALCACAGVSAANGEATMPRPACHGQPAADHAGSHQDRHGEPHHSQSSHSGDCGCHNAAPAVDVKSATPLALDVAAFAGFLAPLPAWIFPTPPDLTPPLRVARTLEESPPSAGGVLLRLHCTFVL